MLAAASIWPLLLSPLGNELRQVGIAVTSLQTLTILPKLQWPMLGLTGEAHPSWPFLLAATVVPLVAAPE